MEWTVQNNNTAAPYRTQSGQHIDVFSKIVLTLRDNLTESVIHHHLTETVLYTIIWQKVLYTIIWQKVLYAIIWQKVLYAIIWQKKCIINSYITFGYLKCWTM